MAWRNLRDWVMVQLALSEAKIVDILQAFLPSATDGKGKTLDEHV